MESYTSHGQSIHDRLNDGGRMSLGLITVVLANAGFLAMYIIYDLTLFQLVAVYWWECLWIGIFSALKLIVASVLADPYENRWVQFSRGSRVLTSIVAIFFVSAEFLTLFFLLGFLIIFAFQGLTGIDEGDLMISALGPVLGSSMLFLVGHGLSFIANFLVGGEYKSASITTLLSLPFTRCIALIIAIALAFGGALWIPGFANTTGFAVLLLVIKLLWDYWLHKRERRAFAALAGR